MNDRFSFLEFQKNDPNKKESKEFASHSDYGIPQPSAKQFLEEATTAFHQGLFEAALRLYTKCLEEDKTILEAWVGQVRMLIHLEECQEARIWVDKALEVFKNNGELLAAKAQAYIRLEDIDNAYACSDRSIETSGSSPWRWIVRGEVLLSRKHALYDDCFAKALAEKNANWFDRVVIACIYLYHDYPVKALEYLQHAIKAEPSNPYLWYLFGENQRLLGCDYDARASFKRSLEIDPRHKPTLDSIRLLNITSPLQSFLRRFRYWRKK